jgi:hypothetical protein
MAQPTSLVQRDIAVNRMRRLSLGGDADRRNQENIAALSKGERLGIGGISGDIAEPGDSVRHCGKPHVQARRRVFFCRSR